LNNFNYELFSEEVERNRCSKNAEGFTCLPATFLTHHQRHQVPSYRMSMATEIPSSDPNGLSGND